MSEISYNEWYDTKTFKDINKKQLALSNVIKRFENMIPTNDREKANKYLILQQYNLEFQATLVEEQRLKIKNNVIGFERDIELIISDKEE